MLNNEWLQNIKAKIAAEPKVQGKAPGHYVEIRAQPHEWRALLDWLSEHDLWEIHRALSSASGAATDGTNWRAMVGLLVDQRDLAKDDAESERQENRFLRDEVAKLNHPHRLVGPELARDCITHGEIVWIETFAAGAGHPCLALIAFDENASDGVFYAYEGPTVVAWSE